MKGFPTERGVLKRMWWRSGLTELGLVWELGGWECILGINMRAVGDCPALWGVCVFWKAMSHSVDSLNTPGGTCEHDSTAALAPLRMNVVLVFNGRLCHF